jgi:hypothetical protein
VHVIDLSTDAPPAARQNSDTQKPSNLGSAAI